MVPNHGAGGKMGVREECFEEECFKVREGKGRVKKNRAETIKRFGDA